MKTLDIARQDVVLDTLVQQGECEHTLIFLLTNMSVYSSCVTVTMTIVRYGCRSGSVETAESKGAEWDYRLAK